MFVADVAVIQPGVQGPPAGSAVHRLAAVTVRLDLGEQHRRAAGVAAGHAGLLVADLLHELLIDGDERLAVHLVVEVSQVGRAVAAADQAVEREADRVGDPQPAADEDEGHQAVGQAIPQAEVDSLSEESVIPPPIQGTQ